MKKKEKEEKKTEKEKKEITTETNQLKRNIECLYCRFQIKSK